MVPGCLSGGLGWPRRHDLGRGRARGRPGDFLGLFCLPALLSHSPSTEGGDDLALPAGQLGFPGQSSSSGNPAALLGISGGHGRNRSIASTREVWNGAGDSYREWW